MLFGIFQPNSRFYYAVYLWTKSGGSLAVSVNVPGICQTRKILACELVDLLQPEVRVKILHRLRKRTHKLKTLKKNEHVKALSLFS